MVSQMLAGRACHVLAPPQSSVACRPRRGALPGPPGAPGLRHCPACRLLQALDRGRRYRIEALVDAGQRYATLGAGRACTGPRNVRAPAASTIVTTAPK